MSGTNTPGVVAPLSPPSPIDPATKLLSGTTTTTGPLLISCFSLACLVVGMFICWWANNTTMLNVLIGVVAANSTSVIHYWIGDKVNS